MDYLIHWNNVHWPAGTPGGIGGQFGPKHGMYGTGRVNRYQYTAQGPSVNGRPGVTQYTEAGKKRYRAEQLKNDAKPKKNRMEPEAVGDVNRWIEDDIKNYQNVATGVKDVAKQTSDIAGKVFKDPPRGRYDLSEMSDAELASILRREQMERQYNDYFNPPQVNKGREYVQDVANAAGVIGGLAATGLGIALSIKQLRS